MACARWGERRSRTFAVHNLPESNAIAWHRAARSRSCPPVSSSPCCAPASLGLLPCALPSPHSERRVSASLDDARTRRRCLHCPRRRASAPDRPTPPASPDARDGDGVREGSQLHCRPARVQSTPARGACPPRAGRAALLLPRCAADLAGHRLMLATEAATLAPPEYRRHPWGPRPPLAGAWSCGCRAALRLTAREREDKAP
nr:unnamed protein product [Digitaria exilis]